MKAYEWYRMRRGQILELKNGKVAIDGKRVDRKAGETALQCFYRLKSNDCLDVR